MKLLRKYVLISTNFVAINTNICNYVVIIVITTHSAFHFLLVLNPVVCRSYVHISLKNNLKECIFDDVRRIHN